MSKLSVVAAVGVTGTGVSLTGAYMLGAFDSADYEVPLTLQLFKDGKGGGCVRTVFSSLEDKNISDLSTGAGEASSSNVTWGTGDEEKGCLVVNWDKWKLNDQSNTKWRGNFRFLWSFSKGDKGFIVYTSASTSSATPLTDKFTVEGASYYLSKSTDGIWSIDKKIEVPTGGQTQELEKSKLPKPGTSLSAFTGKDYWNFLKSDASDLTDSNLCKQQECSKEDLAFKGYWSWKKDTSKESKLGEWSSNLNDWWNVIYTNDKWNMNTLINGVKGEWVEARLSSIPELSASS